MREKVFLTWSAKTCYYIIGVRNERPQMNTAGIEEGAQKMIREGELVVYGSEGVCRVEKIGPLEQGGQAYFTLTPLYGNGAAFVPVAREAALRPALDREEALALIRRMPELECVPEADGKERETEYLRLLRSHDSAALACLGKTIWQRSRENAGKRRGSEREERFRKRAEELLFGELAAALDIPREKVPEAIEGILSGTEDRGE